MIGQILMIIFVTCSTLASQLLVKHAVTTIASRNPGLQGLSWLWTAIFSPGVILAVAIQGIGFIVWVIVVSRMKLGVAFAISGSFFYILIAASSWFLYGEKLTSLQWVGLAFVSTGVLLLSLTGDV